MLPSISQSLLSMTPGGAAAAGPLVSGAGAARSSGAASAKDILDIVDSAVGIAKKAGVLPGTSTRKSAKAKASGAGYASSASKAKSTKTTAKASTAKKSGPLAFLDDPKLSIEDKLMRLLAYLNDKWDKDINKKLQELGKAGGGDAGSKSPSATSGASKPKKSGLLGSVAKLVGAAKAFFPQVGIALEVLKNPAVRAMLSKIGGPVLAAAATAMGFPQLAPLALRYGPGLVDVAADVATFVDTEAGAAESHGAGAHDGASHDAPGDTRTDGAGLSSDRKAQLELMHIQRLMDQQKEMFSLVSNILRTAHDTRMAVIQNVR